MKLPAPDRRRTLESGRIGHAPMTTSSLERCVRPTPPAEPPPNVRVPILSNPPWVDAGFQWSRVMSCGAILATEVAMRALMAVLIGIVLLSPRTSPDRTQLPTVAADTVTIREVRRGSVNAVAGLGELRDALLVERPVGAKEGATSSVFALDADGVLLRRVAVVYGRASQSLIQVVSGVSPGDRIIVSDMRAWDSFERLRLSLRWDRDLRNGRAIAEERVSRAIVAVRVPTSPSIH